MLQSIDDRQQIISTKWLNHNGGGGTSRGGTMIRYLEALANVDKSLDEIYAQLPYTLKRTLENDSFRASANTRFDELASVHAPGSLSATDLSPHVQ